MSYSNCKNLGKSKFGLVSPLCSASMANLTVILLHRAVSFCFMGKNWDGLWKPATWSVCWIKWYRMKWGLLHCIILQSASVFWLAWQNLRQYQQWLLLDKRTWSNSMIRMVDGHRLLCTMTYWSNSNSKRNLTIPWQHLTHRSSLHYNCHNRRLRGFIRWPYLRRFNMYKPRHGRTPLRIRILLLLLFTCLSYVKSANFTNLDIVNSSSSSSGEDSGDYGNTPAENVTRLSLKPLVERPKQSIRFHLYTDIF